MNKKRGEEVGGKWVSEFLKMECCENQYLKNDY